MSSGRTGVAALLCGLLMGGAAVVLAAGGPQPFYLSGKRIVRVAGAVDEQARVYIAPGTPRAVILSPVLGSPVYVASTEKKAFVLDPAKVGPSPDDPDAVLVDSEGATEGAPLAVDGLELRFTVAGKPVVLETRPPKVAG
ncbi:MAG: hypothetical protein MUC67_10710, partial [Acidobacteria bacterium]|nr:hypothetical protein [Acidobacteriota bacterium]